MRIAFLGTGLMGAPMVRRLAAAGHDLTLWNRSRSRAEVLSDIAHVVDAPRHAVADADVIITMLLDGPATWDVIVRQGCLEEARPETLVVDMGSVDPDTDRRIAALALDHELAFLDAPVSGGVVGAEAGSLSIFVGGEAEDFRQAETVFRAMGRPTHLGPVGAGQIAKLANQLIVATTIGAVAEGLHLAEVGGCDPARLREALMGGFADSRILELHGKRMVTGDFTPGGRSAAQLKDLNNALDLALSNSLDLPLAECVRQGFADLVENHRGGELDHSAYFRWLSLRKTRSAP